MDELMSLVSSPKGILISAVVVMMTLYFARNGAHELIRSVFHALYSSLRLGARSLDHTVPDDF